MFTLVAIISTLVLVLCAWQLLRERQRRIERSKPIGNRPQRLGWVKAVVPGDGVEPPTP